eukprot:TRINITY_DN6932_c0_g2_i4.p1 TRINITY_DN6932_c0_g2~~TRINITY_DN6932_c0_g2_i4.p1  ORF type:complete len:751 (+),score=140.31 TRINITY_DN6932_c0_g2_i4:61-2253(+)
MKHGRSLLYRGLTRAQMQVAVVNKVVQNSWLAFLRNVRLPSGNEIPFHMKVGAAGEHEEENEEKEESEAVEREAAQVQVAASSAQERASTTGEADAKTKIALEATEKELPQTRKEPKKTPTADKEETPLQNMGRKANQSTIQNIWDTSGNDPILAMQPDCFDPFQEREPQRQHHLQHRQILQEDFERLFDHWGTGGKHSPQVVGVAVCPYIINTDGMDFDITVEFEDQSERDALFAGKLKQKVVWLAALEDYVIFEVKLGCHPLFRDQSYVTQLIFEGKFFEVFYDYCESTSSGPEDHGEDTYAKVNSETNKQIEKAKGDGQMASKLAYDLRSLRWTVEEIDRQKKRLLPYARRDSEPANQREITLRDALLNHMQYHPKVDAAWLTPGKLLDPLKEIDCMYKAFLRDQAPDSKQISKKFDVGDKIAFGKEMLRQAKKKYQEELYVKSQKRLFRALSVVESEGIAANQLLLNHVVLDVINGFPGFASTIAAKLDCYLRLRDKIRSASRKECKLQHLDAKFTRLQNSMESFLRIVFGKLKDATSQDGVKDALEFIESEFQEKGLDADIPRAINKLMQLANSETLQLLAEKNVENLPDVIDTLHQAFEEVESMLDDAMRRQESGSVSCHELLRTPLHLPYVNDSFKIPALHANDSFRTSTLHRPRGHIIRVGKSDELPRGRLGIVTQKHGPCTSEPTARMHLSLNPYISLPRHHDGSSSSSGVQGNFIIRGGH